MFSVPEVVFQQGRFGLLQLAQELQKCEFFTFGELRTTFFLPKIVSIFWKIRRPSWCGHVFCCQHSASISYGGAIMTTSFYQILLNFKMKRAVVLFGEREGPLFSQFSLPMVIIAPQTSTPILKWVKPSTFLFEPSALSFLLSS